MADPSGRVSTPPALLSGTLNSSLCSSIQLSQFDPLKPIIVFLGGSWSDASDTRSIDEVGPHPFQEDAQINNWVEEVTADENLHPTVPYVWVTNAGNPNSRAPRGEDFHGVVVVRHFATKEDQAFAADSALRDNFQDVADGYRPIVLVGYSSGADAAFILAYLNNLHISNRLNITDIIMLQPTFSGNFGLNIGRLDQTGLNTVDSNLAIMGLTTLIYGTDIHVFIDAITTIYDPNDDVDRIEEFIPDDLLGEITSEYIRGNYGVEDHWDETQGTNSSEEFIDYVFDNYIL